MRPEAPFEAPLLAVRDLLVTGRAGAEIVKRVSLTVSRGEVVGLIGESGAGKSTIGLAALGYARPGSRFAGGQVIFDGRDLLALPERALQQLRGVRIAYVAQSAAAFFNPAQRLIDQLTEVLTVHDVCAKQEARARAVQLYERLGLPDAETFGQRYPHQVSGGQLQRAMIAMAMACKPDLIVFDEPTTALDVTTQVGVLAAIRVAVRESGSAALYISHDLAVVAQLADRIMVLRHGAEVEQAATAQLLAAPTQDYTRRLLAADPAQSAERGRQDVLLKVEGVMASYGARRVLDDVSLEVPRGRTLAVVGESGSGKSTLARVITGLLVPSQGQICLTGARLPAQFEARSKELHRRVQLIYQLPDTALNPRQSVAEILGRPLQFYFGMRSAQVHARVAELLEQVELAPDIAERFAGQLSGGQKQRICIARALAARPELILCDEVTSGLDPLVAQGVLALLARLQAQSETTYLFITHDLKIVAAIADEVVVMQAGRIVESGPRQQVLQHSRTDYTKALIASVPQMDPGWLDRAIAEAAGGGA